MIVKVENLSPIPMKGKTVNRYANSLYGSEINLFVVREISKSQFSRDRHSYEAESLFSSEDLEQEIWARVFASDITSIDSLQEEGVRFAELIRRSGQRKRPHVDGKVVHGPSAVPLSQLPKNEAGRLTDEWYSGIS